VVATHNAVFLPDSHSHFLPRTTPRHFATPTTLTGWQQHSKRIKVYVHNAKYTYTTSSDERACLPVNHPPAAGAGLAAHARPHRALMADIA
jgi:hypothetical protein